MNHQFDQRQFARMREALLAFQTMPQSIGSLSALISNLDFLIETLQDTDRTRRNTLRHSWGILEDVYAVALDDEKKTLSDNDAKLIQKAISEFEPLLESEGTLDEG